MESNQSHNTGNMLQSREAPGSYGRKMKRSDYRVIPHRWYQVLSMHLAGKKVKEIKESTGYSESTIYNILDNEEVNTVRQQLLAYYDKEFEALYPGVIEAIRQGLQNPEKMLEAASLWGRMSGKGKEKDSGKQMSISAENVAIMILQQAKDGNKQVAHGDKDLLPSYTVYEANND